MKKKTIIGIVLIVIFVTTIGYRSKNKSKAEDLKPSERIFDVNKQIEDEEVKILEIERRQKEKFSEMMAEKRKEERLLAEKEKREKIEREKAEEEEKIVERNKSASSTTNTTKAIGSNSKSKTTPKKINQSSKPKKTANKKTSGNKNKGGFDWSKPESQWSQAQWDAYYNQMIDDMNNSTWEKTGEGEIDPGGNTWEGWEQGKPKP